MAKNFEGRRGLLMVLASLLAGGTVAQANPSGGSIAAGSATISGTGTPSVTINQVSNTAIINWNSFSIGAGELTTFVQPSAASAILNRVTGGGITSIDGTLNANGQVFIINGNGIFIGKSGAVNTAGFTASTLDVSNADFLKNSLQFSGSSSAGVQNLGTISAAGGSIYLIGQTVDNEGSLSALNGTVGLAAAQSVLITQSGTQHVFVSSTPSATISPTVTGVTNRGSIAATAAELRAANGNMYALAINNGGTIRATTVQKQGGHIYLTSDSGVIVNTGTVDASATAAAGAGGAVQFKTSEAGTVVNHGSVIAHGGQGGTGGTVDLSGGTLDFEGGVDLTSPGGKTGTLLLDPQSIDIISSEGNGVVTTTGTTTTYTPAPNYTGSTLYVNTLEAQLAIANVVIDGISNVTVDSDLNADMVPGIVWGDTTASTSGKETASSLTLETTGKGGTIDIDAPIDGHETVITGTATTGTSTLPKATLVINDEGNGYVTTSADGTISVDNFTLEAGIWQQILTTTTPTAAQLKAMPGLLDQSTLPAFTVGNDFQLDGTSTFERFAGGNGLLPTAKAPNNSPYVIDDIFALQGIGSPSDTLLGGHYALGQDIYGNTTEWNGGDGIDGGAGWVPIGEGGTTVKPFTGTLDGEDYGIDGIYLYRLDDDLTGLFGEITGTVENLGVGQTGGQYGEIAGIVAGRVLAGGVVNDCVAYNATSTEPKTPATGTTANQSQLPQSTLGVSTAAGGLVGQVMTGGLVENSTSETGFVLLGSSGVFGLTGVGGLVGINDGIVTNCYSFSTSATTNSVQAFGTTKSTVEEESINIGGLVGLNNGTINGGESAGLINPIGSSGTSTPTATSAGIISGVGNFNIGGFVGANYGTIDTTVKVGGKALTYQAFTDAGIYVASGTATGPDVYGGTGSYYVGGFVGVNYGHISDGYAAPNISDSPVDGDGGGQVVTTTGTTTGTITIPGGEIEVSNNLQPAGANGSSGTGALGDIAIGGFAGGNFGSIIDSGSEDVVDSGANIKGVGNVTVGYGSKATTEPEPAKFSAPLALDSVFVGGFVGLNGAGSSISASFSDPNAVVIDLMLEPTTPPTAAAPGTSYGLVGPGSSGGALVTSTGDITGGTGYSITGGFAGGNYGTIVTSFSSGDVNVSGTTSQSNSFYTGGFAGISSGGIADVYESGNVASTTTNSGGGPNDETGVVGGLVAQMNAGTVSYTYETGTVTGGTTRGGLVGVVAAGVVSRSFWDTTSNSTLAYSAGGTGAKGYPETSMASPNLQLDITPSTEATSIYHANAWNFTTIWIAPSSSGLPTLRNVPQP